MSRYAREADAVELEVIPATKPFSNFDFIDRRFEGLLPLRRIFSQARLHGYQTLVVEQLRLTDDLREENDDLAQRIGLVRSSAAWRISFFTKAFKTTRGLKSATNEDFLGYAVVKADDVAGAGKSMRVYEAVMRPSRRSNNFIRGAQTWRCAVAGQRFQVSGYLYAQQNGLTNSCAHVAVRTAAARFHPDGDLSYREMNRRAGKRGKGAVGGLTVREIRLILESAGAVCCGEDYTSGAGVPFQKYLYGSVESGFPAILVFQTTAGAFHAIPIFGHTFNEDTWAPKAEFLYFQVGPQTIYLPSESWVSMYIGHDDNCGSNFCIPRGYLHEPLRCEDRHGEPCPFDNADIVAAVIGTLPRGIRMNAVEAEVIGAGYLLDILAQQPSQTSAWGERLRLYARRHRLVLRPLLLRMEDYLAHLATLQDWRGERIARSDVEVLKRLASRRLIWLIELSVPELFAGNRRKVAEVLLDAETAPGENRDGRSFVIARIPGYFVSLVKADNAARLAFQFLLNPVTGHVALYAPAQPPAA